LFPFALEVRFGVQFFAIIFQTQRRTLTVRKSDALQLAVVGLIAEGACRTTYSLHAFCNSQDEAKGDVRLCESETSNWYESLK